MGVKDRMVEVLGGVTEGEVAAMREELEEGAGARAHEAYMAGYNDRGEDEPSSGGVKVYGYREEAAKKRDLSTISQEKAIEAAYRLWSSTPVGWRLVELAVDFIVKGGAVVVCDDAQVREVVDGFWGLNEMDEQQELLVRELVLFGELLVQVFVRDGGDVGVKGDGRVMLGVVDPGEIYELVCDVENASDLVAVRLKSRGSVKGALLKVVRRDEETGRLAGLRPSPSPSPGGREEEGTCVGQGWRVVEGKGVVKGNRYDGVEYDGECFYFAVNRIRKGNRGRPYLLPLVDWIDRDDQLFFDVLEWAAILRAFVWDLLVQGGDDQKVRAEVRRLREVRPGGVFGHNERITLEAKNPSLHAADFEHLIRQLRVRIAGGAGYPEHWMGEGGYTNRATAAEMGAPTFTMLTRRQGYVRAMLVRLCRFAVDMAVEFGRLPEEVEAMGEDGRPTGEVRAVRDTVDVVMPEISERDMAVAAGAFGQVAAPVVMANAQGLLPNRQAVEVLAAVSALLGVEMDVAAVMEELGGYSAEGLREALENRE